MPCCGGQGPCCGSLARAKSRTWNWPSISKSMRAGPSQRLEGTSWRGVSCHFVNVRTCSSSRWTERNSFCVLVSSLGASCARFAMHLSRSEATGAWVARRDPCSRAAKPCRSTCAALRCTAGPYGRGGWRGRAGGAKRPS